MTFPLLIDLCESRLIPSRPSLKKWDEAVLTQLAYLYFLTLRILVADDDSKKWAQTYCEKTAQPGNFNSWRTDGNDLYVLLYALCSDSEFENAKRSISTSAVRDWLRHTQANTFQDHTQRLFNRLDAMFKVTDSGLKNMRRMVAHWPDASAREREDIIVKLIQRITKNASHSELLSHLKRLSKQYNSDDTVTESASSGATGAASIATAVGGLGAGFDPAGARGIYGSSKPVVLKRIPNKKKPGDDAAK